MGPRRKPALDCDGLAAMVDEVGRALAPPVEVTEVDCHIDDQAYAGRLLQIFGAWIADGTLAMSVPEPL